MTGGTGKRSRLGNVALTDAPATADAVRTVHAAAAAPRGEALREVPVGALARSPWQPREAMDSDRLDELAESIRARGVLEPLLAREVTGEVTGGATKNPGGNPGENSGGNNGGGPRLELLAGERRLEAARRAGLATVPVRVLSGLSDAEAREVAVVENLARADLTVWDEARALLALRDARRAEGKPDDVRSVAAAAGRSSATTWRRLRVAERLTPDVVAAVRASVSSWHAIADNAVALEAAADADTPEERGRVLRTAAGASAPGLAAQAARERRPAERPPMTADERATVHVSGTPGAPLPPATYALTGGADTRLRLSIRGPVADLPPDEARQLARALAPVLAALRVQARARPRKNTAGNSVGNSVSPDTADLFGALEAAPDAAGKTGGKTAADAPAPARSPAPGDTPR
jgi:ParB family chromosome partitioning protein